MLGAFLPSHFTRIMKCYGLPGPPVHFDSFWKRFRFARIPSVSRIQSCRTGQLNGNGSDNNKENLHFLRPASTAPPPGPKYESSRSRPTAQNSSFASQANSLQDPKVPKRATLLNSRPHGAKAAPRRQRHHRDGLQQRGANLDTRRRVA